MKVSSAIVLLLAVCASTFAMGCGAGDGSTGGDPAVPEGTPEELAAAEAFAGDAGVPGLESQAGYYITYAALLADRVSCPSGYTRMGNRCGKVVQGAARPYERTCSQLSRCARDDI